MSCKTCPANTNSELPSSDECLPCDAGSRSVAGSAICSKCDAGQADTGANGGCENCDAGQYRISSMSAVSCTQCPAGFSQSNQGQASCTMCSPGEFNSLSGQASCTLCSKSTYFGGKGRNSSCTSCPTGWLSTDRGSAKCQACGAGSYGDGCQLCPLGYARAGTDTDATQCHQCKLGSHTTIEGAATCSKCDLGMFGNTNGDCTTCPAGKYQDGKGEMSCKLCDVDKYLSEEGKSSNADCIACDLKKATGKKKGNTKETSCQCRKKDYYKNSKDDSCVDCPTGADCSKHDGALLSEIYAKPGYYRYGNNFVSCSQTYTNGAEDKATERCCPYAASNKTSICSITTNASESESESKTQCLKGFTGVLCLECSKDYVKQGDDCTECSGGGDIGAALVPVFILCALLYVVVVISLIRSASKAEVQANQQNIIQRTKTVQRLKKVNKVFGQGKILLSLVQIIASMPTVLVGVNFPPFFVQVTRILGIFNFDILAISTPLSQAFGCSLSVRFFDRFIIHLMLPILCLFAIGSAVMTAESIRRCCFSKKDTKKKTKKNATKKRMSEDVYKIIVLVILLLFPGLSTKLFSMFNCRMFDGIDDKYLLVQDYAIDCNQGEHVSYSVIAVVFLILFIVGVPLVMFILLYCNRKHLHDIKSKKHHMVKASLGGLYLQYEPSYWYFELLILLNKTIMCGGLVLLSPGSPSQVLCAIVIMLFHLLLVISNKPYLNYSEDVSSVVSALGLTLLYICALMKMLEDKTKEDLSYISEVLDTLPIICIVLVIVIMLFGDYVYLLYCCCSGSKADNHSDNKKKNSTKGKAVHVKVVPKKEIDSAILHVPLDDDNQKESTIDKNVEVGLLQKAK